MSIGAVIVTYNSRDHVTQAVRSLWANQVSNIVVVDNGSSDSTITNLNRLGVTLIRNPGNCGFGAACNAGAHYLSDPYILFLNPDASLDVNALARAFRHLISRPNYAAVGLGLSDQQGQIESYSHGRRITPLTFFLRRLPSRRIEWVSAGAILVRRQALRQAGGFDPRFFMYWEDVDLCLGFSRHRWQVGYLPSASVKHVRGASLAEPVLKTRFYDISADKYFRKHYAAPIWLFYRWFRRLYRLLSPRAR